MNQKATRIEIEKHIYFVYKDLNIEEGTMAGTFDKVLIRFLLTDTDKPLEVIGCVVFTLGLLSAYSWETDEDTNYGKSEMKEFAFANLLPHIPFGIQNLVSLYGHGLMCLILSFSQEDGSFNEEQKQFKIQLKDSFFKTAQKLFFPNGLIKKDIEKEILKILRNYREDYPETIMPFEELEASIPLTSKSLAFYLGVLDEEGKLKLNYIPHSDPPKILGVKISAAGINTLEGEEANFSQKTQFVKQVFGTNIENLTTHGNSSPININIGDVKTVIENITKVVKSKDFSKKDEVLLLLKNVGEEIEKDKDQKKIKGLLEQIKSKSAWVYNLIFQNPVLTAYLTQLLLKTI